MPKLPGFFLAKLRSVTGKRPKTVIDHILKHGQITTEELKDVYGYNHPPRAVKDVTDLGIPIARLKVKGKDGRTIAAYTFGDPAELRGKTHSGRRIFPKAFKESLIQRDGSKCAICSGTFPASVLQIDHRVPYEVAGQAAGQPGPDDYMLLCRTCNRAKSWACEHCPNCLGSKDPDVCRACFWGNPIEHTHIATVNLRRLDIVWSGDETREYDQFRAQALAAGENLPDYVKAVLRRDSNR